VPLEQEIGAQNAVNAAKQLGIQFRAPSDASYANNANGWGAFTLGVSAATPLDMANAYATLAADGLYCDPLPVVEIHDFNGAKLDAANPRCHQAVDPNVAHAATDAMRCPIGDQSAFGRCDGATAANVRGIVGKPTAGKTGTTDGDQTAALVAMTKQLAVAGIVADPDWAFTTNLRRNLGGRDPHADVVNPAVAYTLHDAVAGKPSVNFAGPTASIAFGSGKPQKPGTPPTGPPKPATPNPRPTKPR
jgi:membrane peptidoglycan carboxypeptidase